MTADHRQSLIVCALLLTGCADDGSATSETDAETGSSTATGSPTTTDAPTTDDASSTGSTGTEDPSSTDDESASATASGSEDGTGTDGSGSTSSDGTTGSGSICGDGLVEGDEACDGAEIGAETCVTKGFVAGALACSADCSEFDTTDCLAIPACVEQDLGSAVGDVVATGDTTDEDEDITLVCSDQGNTAPDHVMLWVAPSAGRWRFSTQGSAFSTALAIYASCDADQPLACDVNGGGFWPFPTSLITLPLEAGDPLILVMSGFGGWFGQWTLAITPVEIAGPCCANHPGLGCDFVECTDAVCAADASCCYAEWSDACATLASATCEICNTPDACGNGVLDGMGEACDSFDFDGETCTTLGFDGGAVACPSDCTAIDTTSCFSFGGNCCATHVGHGCDDAQCTADVCGAMPSCCEEGWEWDSNCVALADQVCNALCTSPGICGNGIVDADGEECDETDLAGSSCQDFGFQGGYVYCTPECSVATEGCADFSGDCCAEDWTPGCDDDACSAFVCAADSHCCEWGWDWMCTQIAAETCEVCGGAPPECGNGVQEFGEGCDGADFGDQSCVGLGFIGGALDCGVDCQDIDAGGCIANGGGDCCAADGTPGCDDLGCTLSVCADVPACCAGSWDDTCVTEAEQVCTPCGGLPVCADTDLGSALGSPVATGSTIDEDASLALPCGAEAGSPDSVLAWVAPADGTYVFRATGGFNVVLGVSRTCDPATLLGCGGSQYVVELALTAGESLLIAVSGYGNQVGGWALDISQL